MLYQCFLRYFLKKFKFIWNLSHNIKTWQLIIITQIFNMPKSRRSSWNQMAIQSKGKCSGHHSASNQKNTHQQCVKINPNQYFDIFSESQSFGIEPVIIQHNQSVEESPTRRKFQKNAFQQNFQGTPEFTANNEIVDFSTMHKLQQKALLNYKNDPPKQQRPLIKLTRQIQTHKKELSRLKQQVSEFVCFTSQVIRTMIIKLQIKYEERLSLYLEQQQVLKQKNKMYMVKLEQLRVQNFQLYHQKCNHQVATPHSPKLQILQHQNRTLKQQLNHYQQMSHNFSNDKTKEMYLGTIQQFSAQIKRIQEELVFWKNQQSEKTQFLSNWEAHLQEQQSQIQEVIAHLQQKEEDLANKTDIVEQKYQWVQKKEREIEDYLRENQKKMMSQQNWSYSESKYLYQRPGNIKNSLNIQSSSPLRKFLKNPNPHLQPSRIKTEASIRKNHTINIANRLSTIRLNIKKELKSMGYGF